MKNENTGNLRTFCANAGYITGEYQEKKSLFVVARKQLAMLALGLSAMLSIGQSNAQTIIFDDFNSGTGVTPLQGHTPTTSLPGTSWVGQSFSEITAVPYVDNSLGLAYTIAYGSGSIGIGSTGGYVKPSILTISASISMNDVVGGIDSFARGVGIGFYSPLPTGGFYPSSYFHGFTVAPNGSLTLYVPGAGENALFTASPLSGFSTSAFYTLSFSVDTTSGNITSVLFGSQDYTSQFSGFTGIFTDSVTNYAGFYGFSEGETPAGGGLVDNFTVAVPEPSTYALAFCGVLVLTIAAVRSRRASSSI